MKHPTCGLVRQNLREAVRSRWLPILMVIVAAISELLLRFSGSVGNALTGMLDLTLILGPLAGLVVGTLQIQNGRDLTELLLAQPVRRSRVFLALYLGHALPLIAALVIGLSLPFALRAGLVPPHALQLGQLLLTAVLLAAMTMAMAMVIAMRIDDRVRALGLALGIWLLATVLWDALVLMIALGLGNRPVEVPVLMMLALNPIDIARVLNLLGSESAALLGHTGAVLQHALGTYAGRGALAGALLFWIIGPLLFAARTFAHKDF